MKKIAMHGCLKLVGQRDLFAASVEEKSIGSFQRNNVCINAETAVIGLLLHQELFSIKQEPPC